MQYVVGAVLGLVWGALLAWVNSRINKRAVQKNSSNAVMAASLLRTLIDLLGLGAVFLLRKVLPFNCRDGGLAGSADGLLCLPPLQTGEERAGKILTR